MQRWPRVGRRPTTRISGAVTAVWDKSVKAVSSSGRGPFSKSTVDRLLGFGRWRGIARFPLQQRDRFRARGDACRSGHNDATSLSEILHCDSVDFPARVARRLMAVALARHGHIPAHSAPQGSRQREERPTVRCWHRTLEGTGSIASTVQMDSAQKWFVVSGCLFGLSSSVIQFNRLPEIPVAGLWRIWAVLACHNFDVVQIRDTVLSARCTSAAARFWILSSPQKLTGCCLFIHLSAGKAAKLQVNCNARWTHVFVVSGVQACRLWCVVSFFVRAMFQTHLEPDVGVANTSRSSVGMPSPPNPFVCGQASAQCQVFGRTV